MLSLMRDGIKPSDRIEPFHEAKGRLPAGIGRLTPTPVQTRISRCWSAANEQHDCVGVDCFLSADRPHFFAGLRLDIDLADVDSQQLSDSCCNRVFVRGQLRSLGMDRAIEVADLPATLSHFVDCGEQKMSRVGITPLRIGIRKPFSDITQSNGPKDCVGDGMQQDIGITVSVQAQLKLDGYSTQDQRPARHQPMPVVPQSYSYTRIAHRALSASIPRRDSNL